MWILGLKGLTLLLFLYLRIYSPNWRLVTYNVRVLNELQILGFKGFIKIFSLSVKVKISCLHML